MPPHDATFRALQIAEIFDIVLAMLDDKASLAHLAAVCHTFYEPAMDRLWAELPSIAPIVQCLPADAVSTQPARKKCWNTLVSGSYVALS